ncbi:MAG TPA: magnesium transporter CorA, partial [Mycobacterium sp.]
MRTLAPTETEHPAPADDQPADLAVVDCAVYVDGQRLDGSCSYPDAKKTVTELRLAGREAFAWIGLHAPTEHQMQEVGDVFGLHPLAIEDAVL